MDVQVPALEDEVVWASAVSAFKWRAPETRHYGSLGIFFIRCRESIFVVRNFRWQLAINLARPDKQLRSFCFSSSNVCSASWVHCVLFYVFIRFDTTRENEWEEGTPVIR